MKALTRKHWTYISGVDKEAPEAERTVWHLKCINKTLYAEVMEAAAERDGSLNFSGRVAVRILEAALVGWENLTDPDDGKPIPYPDKVGTAIEHIPGAIRAELATEVLKRSTITEDEKKN